MIGEEEEGNENNSGNTIGTCMRATLINVETNLGPRLSRSRIWTGANDGWEFGPWPVPELSGSNISSGP